MDNNDLDNETLLYVRSMDEVKSMIDHAKLNEKNLTNVTQTIYFSTANEKNEYKLLELNSHLLSAIEEGQNISFKGGLNEKVVLCTNTKTFELKEAEISNSLLVIPNLKLAQATSKSPLKSPQGAVNRSLDKSSDSNNDSVENIENDDNIERRQLEQQHVLKVFHDYFECREIKPRFRKLHDILILTRYSGPENEYCVDRSVLFTRKQLLDTIQCSRAEFDDGLKQLRAIEIAGRIRALDVEYEYRIVSLMLNCIAEMGWRLNEVNRGKTIELLVPVIAPEEIVGGLFDLYTVCQPATSNRNELVFNYREDLVCRIIAENILQQGMKFHIDDFMSTWQNALPEGMAVNELYLKGIGIIDRESSNMPCVRSLIESNLPVNLHERLKVLFKARPRWTLDQIEPYIEYFTTAQLTITSILAKHARSMTVDGVRVYVSKHGL